MLVMSKEEMPPTPRKTCLPLAGYRRCHVARSRQRALCMPLGLNGPFAIPILLVISTQASKHAACSYPIECIDEVRLRSFPVVETQSVLRPKTASTRCSGCGH